MDSEPIYETRPLPEPQQIDPVVPDSGDVSEYFPEHFATQASVPPGMEELRNNNQVRAYFPDYAFLVTLKFCNNCVRRLIDNPSVVEDADGIYLLRYHMCQNCIKENIPALRKW